MKYIVSMAVEGRVDVEVEASNTDKAFEAAKDAFCDADLSKMDVVDYMPVNTTDESGKLVDYR